MTIIETVEDGHGRIIEQLVDHGDGTGSRTVYDADGNVTSTEQVTGLPLPPPPTIDDARALLDDLDAEARLAAVAEQVTPEQAVILIPLLRPWTAGETVAAGALRSHDHKPWEAIQAHTTQDGWTPDVTPALWRVWRSPDAGPQPWVQPTGAHDAYGVGDQVTHQGKTWTSTVAANVWEPGTGSLWVEG